MPEPLEIHIDGEGDVDVDAVMRQIREHILARKVQGGTSVASVAPHFEGRFDPMVYEHLYYASLLHDQIRSPLQVIPSRVPVLGPILNAVRRKFHELTLFYTDRLAQKQITFNAHVIGALNALVHELEGAPESEVASLRAEIESLRQRVQLLEEKQ